MSPETSPVGDRFAAFCASQEVEGLVGGAGRGAAGVREHLAGAWREADVGGATTGARGDQTGPKTGGGGGGGMMFLSLWRSSSREVRIRAPTFCL